MTTKKVTKLLAVVALATGPVVADPTPIANRAPIMAVVKPDPWASTAIVRVEPRTAPIATPPPPAFSLMALVERLVQPRTMPSGAPACGNVASRAPQPVDCERRRP